MLESDRWATAKSESNIVMSSYAPLFVNVNPGGMQWASDLIGYDALISYGSPSYYAQVLFASCLGDQTVDTTVPEGGDKFFYSATMSSKSNEACVKLVNASSSALSISLNLNGLGNAVHQARLSTLQGNTIWATNSLEHPDRIVPVNSTMTLQCERLKHTMPGYSISASLMARNKPCLAHFALRREFPASVRDCG